MTTATKPISRPFAKRGRRRLLLEINSKGLIPILPNSSAQGITTDSLAILTHLESSYPTPSTALLPSSPTGQDIATKWLTHINVILNLSYFRLLQAQPSNMSQSAKALEPLTAAIALLSAARKEGGSFFYGKAISLGDVAIAPWAVRDYSSGVSKVEEGECADVGGVGRYFGGESV
ncbi:uncharacterized protein RSE6_03540 [Rhynchosporium secalis]|uniref:GST N-terminal domain-containing protein n=1 Tax=Rhynchosporium secalis TaxID=38038 RepID=A0A1E1M320_RHYSE|nr:uncharacterized protein RSE6_03540 [Rhynchosporium secalis]